MISALLIIPTYSYLSWLLLEVLRRPFVTIPTLINAKFEC